MSGKKVIVDKVMKLFVVWVCVCLIFIFVVGFLLGVYEWKVDGSRVDVWLFLFYDVVYNSFNDDMMVF